MSNYTWNNNTGGNWNDAADWSPGGGPPIVGDSATIATAGTYTVAITDTEEADTTVLNAANATFSIASGGQFLNDTSLTLNAGTFDDSGILFAGTVTNLGATVGINGKLDGVTWVGPLNLAGDYNNVHIKDGLTLLAADGVSPGTITFSGYDDTLSVDDGIALSGLTIDANDGAGGITQIYGSGSIASNLTFASDTIIEQAVGNHLNIHNYSDSTFNYGTWNLGGSGSQLYLDGGSFENDGTISIGALATGTIATGSNTQVTNNGTINISGSTSFIIEPGTGSTITNSGTISVATSGTVTLEGNVAGNGLVKIATHGTIVAAQNIVGTTEFLDKFGNLVVQNGTAFTGPIEGYQAGDKIDFSGETITGLTYSSSGTTSGHLIVSGSGGEIADLHLIGDYNQSQFSFTSDGTGGTYIGTTAPPPCFALGTRIRTPAGDVAVETLNAGDVVVTHDGRHEPVLWIGQRSVDISRHPEAEKVRPIEIAAGAFGPGLPERAVILSPDHALFVDGVLIPVKHLVDGESIRAIDRPRVTYFHVELARHDILLADGLPCESFLDTGNRNAFSESGAVMQLHPDFAHDQQVVALMWDVLGCAPLHVTGAVVDGVRARLAALTAECEKQRVSA